MRHLNPYHFYELASKLHALFTASTGGRVVEMFAPLTEAQTVLDGWIKGDFFPLDTSKNDAVKLLAKIGNLFSKHYIDPSNRQLKPPSGEDRVDAHEMAMLYALLEQFEHALAAELTHAPTYRAAKCGIYSTHDLAENASLCFSDVLRAGMSDASLTEFNLAGRALAFGFGTAAVMHLLRAIELVLKRYCEAFFGPVAAKTERSYNIYLKKLSALADDESAAHRPDKRLLQMLAQIKEHYRAPLTSPETVVSLDQAMSLFALASAAITLMVEQALAVEALAHDDSSGAVASVPKVKLARREQDDAGADASDEKGESYDFRASKAG